MPISPPPHTSHGTEVSFRLGPGSADDARSLAERLAKAAIGSRRHVLFLNDEAGEYGCLAEWEREEDARAYGELPEVQAVLAELAQRTDREPRVRRYVMEEQPTVKRF